MQLLDNRVMLRPVKMERVTAGGIIIPETQKTEVLAMGEVEMVGGAEMVKPGDFVIYLANAGSRIEWNQELAHVVFEDDIVAIIDNPQNFHL